ncbi:MAG: hypothetical protein IRD7MM_06620 [Candidatus Midichloria mitochondrii]|nr:hypothetical protein [Candidatus Midichloria mitochondrii]
MGADSCAYTSSQRVKSNLALSLSATPKSKKGCGGSVVRAPVITLSLSLRTPRLCGGGNIGMVVINHMFSKLRAKVLSLLDRSSIP